MAFRKERICIILAFYLPNSLQNYKLSLLVQLLTYKYEYISSPENTLVEE